MARDRAAAARAEHGREVPSFLDHRLLPREARALIAIFTGHVEIERRLSQLQEDYAESSVSSYFALSSTVLNGAAGATKSRVTPSGHRWPPRGAGVAANWPCQLA
ncbi:hypothetical protein AB0F91_17310 [Amycolatopsis sp. NPDC023774]|uniref:hypothetical protein n=1 Tax=Amycolatopsis sp. NPDC023774 TaxID=3155015 RepID=UPI0033C97B49